MFKNIFALSSIVVMSNAFAYTSIDTFSCLNNVEVEISQSFMPYSPDLRIRTNAGKFKQVDCQEVADEWNSHGSELCFLHQSNTALFTLTSDVATSKSGMLKIKFDNGDYKFTICPKTQSIQ